MELKLEDIMDILKKHSAEVINVLGTTIILTFDMQTLEQIDINRINTVSKIRSYLGY